MTLNYPVGASIVHVTLGYLIGELRKFVFLDLILLQPQDSSFFGSTGTMAKRDIILLHSVRVKEG